MIMIRLFVDILRVILIVYTSINIFVFVESVLGLWVRCYTTTERILTRLIVKGKQKEVIIMMLICAPGLVLYYVALLAYYKYNIFLIRRISKKLYKYGEKYKDNK